MAAATSSSIWYVYGIVPASFSPASLPPGLDDAAVGLEPHGDVAALVSVLDEDSYAPMRLETSSGDVEWLSPRAVAHDRVLTWASDRGAVIPLPMFSLFSGAEAVQAMLRDRSSQLASTLERLGDGREYALRVYRVDSEFLAAIPALSPRLKEMADTATAASPGQRYLLERKLEKEKTSEMRAITQQLVEQIVLDLGTRSIEQIRSPITRVADGAASRGTMILNTAFLVAPESIEAFQQTLTSLVERHEPQGLRFDFTGPWPPYHFVSEAGHDA
jgi:hypothetical protein